MMRRMAAAVVVALALAGCTSDADPDPGQGQGATPSTTLPSCLATSKSNEEPMLTTVPLAPPQCVPQ